MSTTHYERVAFRGARLLDPATGLDGLGDVIVENGVIADFGPGLSNAGLAADFQIIECSGHCLTPGLIDLHVFVHDVWGREITALGAANGPAAAGGVTSIAINPDTRPVLDDVTIVEHVARVNSPAGAVHIYPMAAATQNLEGEKMSELGLLAEAGAVAFTDGRRAVASSLTMSRLLTYANSYGLTIIQHPEEPLLAAGGAMNEGETATRLGLSAIPSIAETLMIDRDLRLLERFPCRYHISQITCASSLERVRDAKAKGLPVTCGVSPAHFALNENAIEEYRTFAKTSPPLRNESDRQAVVEALHDGTIDIIVSAHDPQDTESKRLPFAQAAFGVVGLETLLPVSLELYHNGDLALLDLLGKMSAKPADLLNLPGGHLARGAPADLTLFDIDRPWRIDAGNFASKAKNTPFDGRPVQGMVLLTMAGGNIIYQPTPENSPEIAQAENS